MRPRLYGVRTAGHTALRSLQGHLVLLCRVSETRLDATQVGVLQEVTYRFVTYTTYCLNHDPISLIDVLQE
jgi:hypothetical protein